MGYETYKTEELLKAAKDAADKGMSSDSDDLSLLNGSLKIKLFNLFDSEQVPTEIQSEIDRAMYAPSQERNQYTFVLDELSYSSENGIKLNMSFSTKDKKAHTIFMKKDENGNYKSIIDSSEFIPVREGVVNNVIIRRTTEKNSDGIYECKTERISKECALSGTYTSFASSKLNIEPLGTEVLEGDRIIDLTDKTTVGEKTL